MATTSIQEMVIQLQDKTEIERLISLINLWICAAIESQAFLERPCSSFNLG